MQKHAVITWVHPNSIICTLKFKDEAALGPIKKRKVDPGKVAQPKIVSYRPSLKNPFVDLLVKMRKVREIVYRLS